MSANNGGKTQVRRTQETEAIEPHTNSGRGSGGVSSGLGARLNQRADRTNGQTILEDELQLGITIESQSFDPSAGSHIGGVVREIQEQQTAYFSYLKAHHQRLTERLKENEREQRELLERWKRLETELSEYMGSQKRQKSALEEKDNNRQ